MVRKGFSDVLIETASLTSLILTHTIINTLIHHDTYIILSHWWSFLPIHHSQMCITSITHHQPQITQHQHYSLVLSPTNTLSHKTASPSSLILSHESPSISPTHWSSVPPAPSLTKLLKVLLNSSRWWVNNVCVNRA